jgi:hypothetical protein
MTASPAADDVRGGAVEAIIVDAQPLQPAFAAQRLTSHSCGRFDVSSRMTDMLHFGLKTRTVFDFCFNF